MAFLGSIGKFLGNVAKPLLKAVPATLTGFASGGKAGALLGGLSALQGGAGSGPMGQQFGTPSIFSGIQTSFAGGYGLPQTPMQQVPMQAVPVSVPAVITKDIFDLILRLAARLGIVIRNPNAVVRMGRSIIARLLRFSRANPGLTIVNLLLNLGLSAVEVNNLLTWYSTHGKRRRRMKVTNVKALNRSVRRLEGFRRLSHRVEAALAMRGVSRSRSRSRRCPKCRKSPCCC